MSRVLLLDTASNLLDLALRCQKAGHQVKWFEAPESDGSLPKAGTGLVDKIHDYNELRRKWLDWADLIYMADNAKYLQLLEPYRRRGYPIFGAGIAASELELDRMAGLSAMKKVGMNMIPSKEFRDYDSAIKFVEKSAKPYVSKPCWDADKDLTYVAKDADDLVFMLEQWRKNAEYRKQAKKHGFILQERITGTEFAVGGFFGPHGWNKYFLENFEYKKLMYGDLGPATGEMGNAAMAVKKSKLFDKALAPLTKKLHDMGYVGYVDNNCIVTDDGEVWPLELTIGRDGCPIRYNRDALVIGDPVEWMIDLVNGCDTLTMKENTVCVAVVVALPPFPYPSRIGKDLDGTPVWNATNAAQIHPVEMRVAQNIPVLVDGKIRRLPNYVATDDYVFVGTGEGATLTGARKSVYSAIEKVKISRSPFYRLDIGAGRLVKQLPVLHKNGFATSWRY